MPGGFDDRKNLLRLLLAFKKLGSNSKSKLSLVIVSSISDEKRIELEETINSLRLNESRITITNHIADSTLSWLYQTCDMLILPSIHEGFGLPALEAMSFGMAVITSKDTALAEIVGFPEALFDPFDVDSIEAKMREVIENPDFRQTLQRHGLKRASEFSWQQSASEILEIVTSELGRKAHLAPSHLKNEPPRCLSQLIELLKQKNGFEALPKDKMSELADAYRRNF